MSDVQEISDTDWQAYAGATGWKGRSSHDPQLRPLIREEQHDLFYTVIAGSEAVEVIIAMMGASESLLLDVAFPTQASALLFVSALPLGNKQALLDLGFVVIRSDFTD